MSKNRYDIGELVMAAGRIKTIHHEEDGKIYYLVEFKVQEGVKKSVWVEQADLHTWAGLTEVADHG